jgi:hypothetical protein
MTAAPAPGPATEPPKPPPSPGLRVFAGAAFAAAAALTFWLMNLPVASRIEPWTVAPGEELSLIGPAGPSNKAAAGAPIPLFTFQAPVGKAVGLRFSEAAPDAATRGLLAALGFPAVGGAGPLSWLTQDGGTSRATIEVALRPTGPHPTVTLALTGDQELAELALKSADATLEVAMNAPLLDTPGPAASLKIGDGRPIQIGGGGAFPVAVEAAAGSDVTFHFDGGAAGGARIRWGSSLDTRHSLTALPVAALKVGAPDGPARLYACGAGPKDISWTTTKVSRAACKPVLQVQGMTLAPSADATVRLQGTAYLATDGEAAKLPLKKITDNPFAALVLGGAGAALGRWCWKVLSAPWPKKAAAPGA